ncbi:MAG: hypothetical protein KAJ14_02995, partial [Candidatus Omnitrophica bacterium]|nr:hypothetical protein [Candidatus Omnitrophota bacterium]
KKLKFSWILDDDYDLVNDEVLSLPYFQNFNFSISGVKYDDSRTKYVDVYLTNEVSELVEISST